MYEDEEEEAMDAMMQTASKDPNKPEREDPEALLGEIKAVAAQLMELAQKL
ncbi:MAG TPA: hypothetical protein VED01_21410 [Burkholderiales bacterium]|nr:hypothetical protein [Burkholderiales bacterium]